jgi:hypothetical protein
MLSLTVEAYLPYSGGSTLANHGRGDRDANLNRIPNALDRHRWRLSMPEEVFEEYVETAEMPTRARPGNAQFRKAHLNVWAFRAIFRRKRLFGVLPLDDDRMGDFSGRVNSVGLDARTARPPRHS